MNSISVEELMLLDNAIIVDVRAYYYYHLGHIDGAINIPYYNLLNNYSHYLNFNSVYYFYCDSGEQSREIVLRLEKFGYHVVNIIGGYNEYLRVFGR